MCNTSSGKSTVIASDCSFYLFRISRVIKHTLLTTEHSELPEEGIHLGCNEYWSYSCDLLLANLAYVDVHRKKWFLLVFNCLFPPKWGRRCILHVYCMKLSPCNIVVNTDIVSLVIKGKGVYELNTTVIGAVSWVKIQRLNG